MSEQKRRQDNVMQLLQIISDAKLNPEDALKQFTHEEIREAQVIAVGGGYSSAEFALAALIALSNLKREHRWFDPVTSRPAFGEKVWVSYIYEGEATVDAGYIDERGWFLDHERRIDIEPYAWQSFAPWPAPVRP